MTATLVSHIHLSVCGDRGEGEEGGERGGERGGRGGRGGRGERGERGGQRGNFDIRMYRYGISFIWSIFWAKTATYIPRTYNKLRRKLHRRGGGGGGGGEIGREIAPGFQIAECPHLDQLVEVGGVVIIKREKPVQQGIEEDT